MSVWSAPQLPPHAISLTPLLNIWVTCLLPIKCTLDRTPVSASPHFFDILFLIFHGDCHCCCWWFVICLLPLTCKLLERDYRFDLLVSSNLREYLGHSSHLIVISWLNVKINFTGMKEKLLWKLRSIQCRKKWERTSSCSLWFKSSY